MNDKEKFRAEIEARLLKFGNTLHEIKMNQKKRKEKLPDIQIDSLIQKQEKASAKLSEIDRTDESTWHKFKSELDNLINDIDDDIRKALAYFG